MAISIKNDEVEQLIRDLAHTTGLSMTEALQLAIEEFLRSHALEASQNVERDIASAMRIAGRIAAMPVLDARAPDEMLYGAEGMPR